MGACCALHSKTAACSPDAQRKIPYLSFRFSPMKGVEVMDGTLGGRPWVCQDLEDVEVVAQRVCGH